jgi:hypothetical protein
VAGDVLLDVRDMHTSTFHRFANLFWVARVSGVASCIVTNTTPPIEVDKARKKKFEIHVTQIRHTMGGMAPPPDWLT